MAVLGAVVAFFSPRLDVEFANVLLVLGIILLVVGFIMGMIYWRCPHCGMFLPRNLLAKNCPSCGKSLDVPRF